MSRLMQQVCDQVFDKKVESVSKACRKPARTCRKSGCKPGPKPGLQLARIMECGLIYAKSRWLMPDRDTKTGVDIRRGREAGRHRYMVARNQRGRVARNDRNEC